MRPPARSWPAGERAEAAPGDRGGGPEPSRVAPGRTLGNGWYGFALDLDATAQCIEGLRRAQQQVERGSELGPLEISVTPSGLLDADTISSFEELGVDRLVVLGLGASAEDLIAFIEAMANRA